MIAIPARVGYHGSAVAGVSVGSTGRPEVSVTRPGAGFCPVP